MRVLELEDAMRASKPAPPPPLSGEIADFIWWLELEAMLNEIGITQVGGNDV